MRRHLIGLLVAVSCLAVSCTGGGIDDDVASTGPPDQLAFAGGIERLELALVPSESYRPDEVVLTDQAAVIISDLLYDGLTEAGTDGRLRPGLAVSWSSDEGFRRWTFELDPFAGVSASRVVETLAPLTSEYGGSRPEGRSVAALVAGMRSVRAADHTTVIVELDRANAGLPWVLSGLPFSIIGDGGAPTGDYSVESHDGIGLVLSRRAGRLASDGRGIREVVVTWVDDPADGYQMLVEGLVDGAVIDPESASDAQTRFGVRFPTTSAVRFYVLNPESATLADLGRRTRLLGEIDRQRVIEKVGGARLAIADGLVPATAFGHDASTCGVLCEIEADSSVADQASSGDDTTHEATALRVSYAGEEQAAMAEAVASQLSEAGYETTWNELDAHDLAAAIVDGSTDLFAFGWVAPSTSIDAVLPALVAADSPANVARIDSVVVTNLLEEAATTADDQARWAILERAHQAALAEAKILPIANSTSLLVIDAELADLVTRADGSIDLETIR